MRRTQLYLDDDLWNALHTQAHQQGTSISELVRQAARQRFLGNPESRRQAMRALVGIRRDQPESPDPSAYVRGLRRGTRLKSLRKK